jgi:hypothetical protein
MQPFIPQPDRKLRFMLSTRVEKSYADAVEHLLAHHGGLQFSKYLRGLIYADAVRCGISLADLDRPAWVTRSYPEIFGDRPRPPAQRPNEQTPKLNRRMPRINALRRRRGT